MPNTIKAFFGDQLTFLTDNGFDVTVISSDGGGGQNFKEALFGKVKFYAVNIPATISPLADWMAYRSILKIIKKEGFDIVQYVTPRAALLGSLASLKAKVPVRLYLMWGLYYVTKTGFKKSVFKTLEKIVCICSTAIAPDSKGNVKFAVEEGLCKEGKIGVVGNGSANGVDLEKFNPVKLYDDGRQIRSRLNISDEATLLGSIAATVTGKGVNELIEAFEKISLKYPQAYLLYIGQTTGNDPVKESTLQKIQRHPKIIHLGWQTEPEKYLSAMDIFVLPTYREGFGVVNIEASAMKIPVISTDVPGPQEAIVHGETGLLVPARTVDPLAKAMEKLIKDPQLALKLGNAGRKRVEECYEQKRIWADILGHKKELLKNADIVKYKEV